MAGAGLGLRLHDARHGTELHERAFAPWWRHAREHYLDLDLDEPPTMTTLYYDPLLDAHLRLPAVLANVTAFYAAPQVPDDARRLWDASCVSAGYDRELALPIPASRFHGASLMMAREWQVADIEARLSAAIEASYEPTWDRELGEFTWGLGLDEPHPRGQFNSFLAAAEAVGPGMWERLSAAPLETCPQVVGVDFPRVALSRAEWHDGSLFLTISPLVDRPAERTQFTIVGAPHGRSWNLDGIAGATVQRIPDGTLTVTVPVARADVVVSPS